ncbi:MAG: GMC family oxidoreductase N-terminal domain-containing protein [Thermomicrobiales bacterium]
MTTTIVVGAGSAGACIAARSWWTPATMSFCSKPARTTARTTTVTGRTISSIPPSSRSKATPGTTTLRPPPAFPTTRSNARSSAATSHNGCTIIWSHAIDYDAWFASGLTQWSTEQFVPFLRRATEHVATWIPQDEVHHPFHQLAIDALPSIGYPYLPNLMDMEIEHGICTNPVNIKHRVRWNTAFAYLDPLRGDLRLQIVPNALVDRVIVRDGRAVGVEVAGPDGSAHYEADRVVLCAGAYGSPLILQRSGIADPALLAPLGIESVHLFPVSA